MDLSDSSISGSFDTNNLVTTLSVQSQSLMFPAFHGK
jgi:hypothetical protein